MTTTSSSDASTASPSPPIQTVPVTLDTQGRVRASKEQRRLILAEFERSGVSAARFAKRTGLKYSTLAGWLQRYRRAKPQTRARPVRLLEAVVEQAQAWTSKIQAVLVLQLPGGAWPGHAEFFRQLEGVRGGGSVRHAQRVQRPARAGDGTVGRGPAPGALFVFSNRRHTRIKILCWDGTGLWVLTKRLEQGTFSWPKNLEPQITKLKLTPQALAMLTDGVDLRGGKLRPWYEREE
jgi:transposase